MKILLGTPKAEKYPFKVKIEDKVIHRQAGTVGSIISGGCCFSKFRSKHMRIFYKIRLLSTVISAVDQSDIDPVL